MRYVMCVFAVLSAFALVGCDAKDACLDQGGSYNEASKTCEK